MAEITKEKEKEVKDLVLKQKEPPVIHENPTPEMLISQAIDRNVPIETMEKLMAMRTQLKAEQSKEAYFQALSKFQAECPVVTKDKKAGTGSYTYNYAPMDSIIAQVKVPLEDNGFSYTVQTRYEQDPPAQVAICIVHHVGGHSESSEFRAPIDTGNMNNIQKNASSVTYAKRYAFCNAFGILTGDEDNDAQSCGDKNNTPPKETSQQKYNKLEQEILVLCDTKAITPEAKKKALDYINAIYPDGTKVIHGVKNLEKLKQHIIELQEEEVLVTPEDDAKLSDDNIQGVFKGTIVDVPKSEGNLHE